MYKLEEINVYDVADDASRLIQEQVGRAATSALSLGFTSDTRNDYFAPSRGARHSLFIQNAGGPLGGDNYFVNLEPTRTGIFPHLSIRSSIFVENWGGSGPTAGETSPSTKDTSWAG